MSVTEEIRRRIKATWPTRHKEQIKKALEAFEALKAKRADIEGNADLSDVGRRKLLVEFVNAKAGPELAAALHRADLSRQKIAADRGTLLQTATANDNAFGPEIRAFMREQSLSEKAALLLGPHADRRAQVAVLAAPSFLSGVHSNLLEQVRANYLDASVGAAMGSLSESEEAIEVVDMTVRLLKTEVGAAIGIDREYAFDQWFGKAFPPKPTEQSQIAEWLKNCDGLDEQLARDAARNAAT